MNKAAIYARVSTIDKSQDINVQVEPLVEYAQRCGYEPVVFAEEGVSGAKTSRPKLDEMMYGIRRREFRVVIVWKVDRLGRSLAHLIQILGEFDEHGVQFHSYTEGMDTSTIHGRAMFQMVGVFSEFYRGWLAENVREGMARVQRHGTRSGNPVGRPRSPKTLTEVLYTLKLEHGSARRAAKALGIARSTLTRILERGEG